MRIVIVLVAFVALLILGFIAWITRFSLAAVVAGVFLIVFISAWGAEMAKIAPLPSPVHMLIGWASVLCLIVIVWIAGSQQWEVLKAKADIGNCQNEKTEKWIKIPAGFYRGTEGRCVAGTPPSPPASSQAPTVPPPGPINACTTPCTMYVDWDVKIETGGRPYSVQFFGKTEFLNRSGRGDKFTLDQFTPGNANFASLDGPLQIELFSAK